MTNFKPEKRGFVVIDDNHSIFNKFDNFQDADAFATNYARLHNVNLTIYQQVATIEPSKTLREYLQGYERYGAYHTFKFYMNNHNIEIDSIQDFESICRSELLDRYLVVNDSSVSVGNDCTNYGCTHTLDLQLIED